MKYGAKHEGSVLKFVLSYNDTIHFENRGDPRGDHVIVGGCGNELLKVKNPEIFYEDISFGSFDDLYKLIPWEDWDSKGSYPFWIHEYIFAVPTGNGIALRGDRYPYEDGLFERWYSNGHKRYKWYYKDGKHVDGISYGFHQEGQLKHEITWKNGQRHGVRKHYYENGNIELRGFYKDGKKEGRWIEYHEETGKILKEEVYEENRYIQVIKRERQSE